jgi:hypothetical protein
MSQSFKVTQLKSKIHSYFCLSCSYVISALSWSTRKSIVPYGDKSGFHNLTVLSTDVVRTVVGKKSKSERSISS